MIFVLYWLDWYTRSSSGFSSISKFTYQVAKRTRIQASQLPRFCVQCADPRFVLSRWVRRAHRTIEWLELDRVHHSHFLVKYWNISVAICTLTIVGTVSTWGLEEWNCMSWSLQSHWWKPADTFDIAKYLVSVLSVFWLVVLANEHFHVIYVLLLLICV